MVFPLLLWLGVPAVTANATSTVALWPAALSSLWGYRREMGGSRDWLLRFGGVSLAGGWVGARLLLDTPSGLFEQVAPLLILAASLLFLIQEPLMRRLKARRRPATSLSGGPGGAHRAVRLVGVLFQFAVAVYGGYFGAGIGILMLANLGLMGMDEIHRMNGVKNAGAMCINGVAAATFVVGGAVDSQLALLMAFGAILGGYGGARAARQLGPAIVRRLIPLIGLAISLSLLLKGR